MHIDVYRNLKPGDRLTVELDERLRIARVVGWEQATLVVQLKRFNMEGWYGRNIRVTPAQCVQVTYTANQVHMSAMLPGGSAA